MLETGVNYNIYNQLLVSLEVIIYCSLICIYYQRYLIWRNYKKNNLIWVVMAMVGWWAFSKLQNSFKKKTPTFLNPLYTISGNNTPTSGEDLCSMIKTQESRFSKTWCHSGFQTPSFGAPGESACWEGPVQGQGWGSCDEAVLCVLLRGERTVK